eukprot:scaffold51278_cov58-Phaeocystis_antarctica.AAC.7
MCERGLCGPRAACSAAASRRSLFMRSSPLAASSRRSLSMRSSPCAWAMLFCWGGVLHASTACFPGICFKASSSNPNPSPAHRRGPEALDKSSLTVAPTPGSGRFDGGPDGGAAAIVIVPFWYAGLPAGARRAAVPGGVRLTAPGGTRRPAGGCRPSCMRSSCSLAAAPMFRIGPDVPTDAPGFRRSSFSSSFSSMVPEPSGSNVSKSAPPSSARTHELRLRDSAVAVSVPLPEQLNHTRAAAGERVAKLRLNIARHNQTSLSTAIGFNNDCRRPRNACPWRSRCLLVLRRPRRQGDAHHQVVDRPRVDDLLPRPPRPHQLAEPRRRCLLQHICSPGAVLEAPPYCRLQQANAPADDGPESPSRLPAHQGLGPHDGRPLNLVVGDAGLAARGRL